MDTEIHKITCRAVTSGLTQLRLKRKHENVKKITFKLLTNADEPITDILSFKTDMIPDLNDEYICMTTGENSQAFKRTYIPDKPIFFNQGPYSFDIFKIKNGVTGEALPYDDENTRIVSVETGGAQVWITAFLQIEFES